MLKDKAFLNIKNYWQKSMREKINLNPFLLTYVFSSAISTPLIYNFEPFKLRDAHYYEWH
ncbi:hypothetical protein CWB69_13635 [Pseudoalteromonas sp. S980]|nr:hypothetical protein CWB83_17325 [Pseudoalteromonas sp. S1691]TMS65318.1 hypothetical protein CWB86_19660 [Pseudoalteromonas sp. S1731]TMS88720.1 hypothetical protein CWB69_13635 [Pseudoalteromonas sp. S980]